MVCVDVLVVVVELVGFVFGMCVEVEMVGMVLVFWKVWDVCLNVLFFGLMDGVEMGFVCERSVLIVLVILGLLMLVVVLRIFMILVRLLGVMGEVGMFVMIGFGIFVMKGLMGVVVIVLDVWCWCVVWCESGMIVVSVMVDFVMEMGFVVFDVGVLVVVVWCWLDCCVGVGVVWEFLKGKVFFLVVC